MSCKEGRATQEALANAMAWRCRGRLDRGATGRTPGGRRSPPMYTVAGRRTVETGCATQPIHQLEPRLAIRMAQRRAALKIKPARTPNSVHLSVMAKQSGRKALRCSLGLGYVRHRAVTSRDPDCWPSIRLFRLGWARSGADVARLGASDSNQSRTLGIYGASYASVDTQAMGPTARR